MSKILFRSLICMAAISAFVSCDNDDIYIGGADDSIIQSPQGKWCISLTVTVTAMWGLRNLRSRTLWICIFALPRRSKGLPPLL